MYETHELFYASNEMIYYFSFWISGWNTVFIRLTALGAYKILDLESGRLFEAGRLLNFHHSQQV